MHKDKDLNTSQVVVVFYKSVPDDKHSNTQFIKQTKTTKCGKTKCDLKTKQLLFKLHCKQSKNKAKYAQSLQIMYITKGCEIRWTIVFGICLLTMY